MACLFCCCCCWWYYRCWIFLSFSISLTLICNNEISRSWVSQQYRVQIFFTVQVFKIYLYVMLFIFVIHFELSCSKCCLCLFLKMVSRLAIIFDDIAAHFGQQTIYWPLFLLSAVRLPSRISHHWYRHFLFNTREMINSSPLHPGAYSKSWMGEGAVVITF